MNNNTSNDSSRQTAVSVYQFDPGTSIRTIIDPDGDPWFVAVDVCGALELSNVGQAMTRLDNDEKRDIILNDAANRPNRFILINESGLYSLILSSRKPEAKAFKKWVTSDVLPSIRKNGQYQTRALSPLEQLEQTVMILKDQQAQLNAIESRVQHVEDTMEAVEGAPQMMTVVAYARWHKINLADGEISKMGKRATAYSGRYGYPIQKTPHAVYGSVNKYHIDVLRTVFSQQSYFDGTPNND